MSLQTAARWVAVAAGVEVAAGLLLVIRPSLLTWLLFGAPLPPAGQALGRLAGFALFALAIACWPRGVDRDKLTSPLLALLLFSVLTAVYLAYLGLVRHLAGPLLWPVAALHLVLGILVALGWRSLQPPP